MLVSLNDVLSIAEARNTAIGAFNTPNLESVIAAIDAAEELNVPLILQHAPIHDELMQFKYIAPIMIECAENAKVPVCVHLDHGDNLHYIEQALDMGFTSVMYDGSTLPYAENIANTKIAVKLAESYDANVEAELGALGKREMGLGHEEDQSGVEACYTDPDQAIEFIEETGIDALACSFGTAHGLYLTEPKLDMSILDRIRAKSKIPLVMHGGSGVSDEDYRTAISKGIRKINYYTYMAKAAGQNVADMIDKQRAEKGADIPIYYHEIVLWGMDAMREDFKKALKVFSGK